MTFKQNGNDENMTFDRFSKIIDTVLKPIAEELITFIDGVND